MLAALQRELPRGRYLYEPKWDGLRWDELDAVAPIQPRQMIERIESHGDLFADVLSLRQTL